MQPAYCTSSDSFDLALVSSSFLGLPIPGLTERTYCQYSVSSVTFRLRFPPFFMTKLNLIIIFINKLNLKGQKLR